MTVCGRNSVLTDVYGINVLPLRSQVELEEKRNKIIVFFKLQPDVITPDNMRDVILVSSMVDSPISTLYHAVQKVFAPMLLKDQKWSKTVDPKLVNLVCQIEGALGSAHRKQDPRSRRTAADEGDDNFAGT